MLLPCIDSWVLWVFSRACISGAFFLVGAGMISSLTFRVGRSCICVSCLVLMFSCRIFQCATICVVPYLHSPVVFHVFHIFGIPIVVVRG